MSGGQKQRLAVARSMATNPDLLILDETTSALDVESELKILNWVLNSRKGGITVIVSHRQTGGLNFNREIVMSRNNVTLRDMS